MKKYLIALAVFLSLAFTVSAAPSIQYSKTLSPETTNTYDLGSLSQIWRSIYVGSVTVGTSTVSSINGMIVVDGVHYLNTADGINNAIVACISHNTTCGEVYIPAGVYTLDKPVLWDANRVYSGVHIKIRGAGIDTTILRLGNNVAQNQVAPGVMFPAKCWYDGTNCFLPTPSTFPDNSFELSDITLDYNGANQTFGSSTAAVPVCFLPDNHFASTYIHNIKCTNTFVPSFNRGTIKYGIGIDTIGARNLTVANSIFTNNDEGIWITDFGYTVGYVRPLNNHFYGNTFSSTTDASIYYEDGGIVDIEGNQMYNAAFGVYGQVLQSSSEVGSIIQNNIIATTSSYGIVMQGNGITISNNTLSSIGERGILVNGQGNSIVGNTLTGVGLNATDIYEDGIYIVGSNHTVIGNTIRNAGRSGIYLENASSTIISNNNIYNAGQNANNSFPGISLTSSSRNNTINGNTIIASSTTNRISYGISADSGSTNTTIGLNTIQGAVTGQYNVNSTSGYFGGANGGFIVSTTTCVTQGLCVQGASVLYGNVGIGKTSPSFNLDILGKQRVTTSADQRSLTLTNTGNDGNFNWWMGQIANDGSDIANGFAFYTDYGGNKNTGANLDRLLITSKGLIVPTGNVGIGTTSPYQKLSVAGNVIADSFIATTTATSTFTGGISTNLLSITSTTASSTFGNGINLTNGCFAVNGTCLTNSTYGDSNVNAYIHASTTIPKTYTSNTFTGAQTFNAGITSNALTLTGLNGPLDVRNGVVGATTTILALYGGTGANLSSANGWGFWSSGVMSASSSPTAPYFTASSSSATTTLAGGLNVAATGLTVLQNGKVGIGTISPTLALNVAGGGLGIDSAQGFYFNTNDSNWRIGKSIGAFTKTINTSGIDLATGNGTNDGFSIGTNTGNSIAEFMGGTGNVFFRNNVGVGSSSPSALVSIHALNGVNNANLFLIGSSTASATTTLFKVNNIGNTTISNFTSNPTFTLSTNSDTAGDRFIVSVDKGLNGVILNSNTTNGNFLFQINGTEKDRISNNGSLAISSDGTYGPSSNLDVNGNASVGNSYRSVAAPTNGLIVQGNVGFATSTPNQALDVNGNVRSSFNSGQKYFLIGDTNASTGSGLEMSYDFGAAISRLTSIAHGTAYKDFIIEGNTLQFKTGSGSTAEALRIDAVGHLQTTGTAPTISACGTSPAVTGGNDTDWRILTGSGGTATSCTLTFANTYTNAPVCTVTQETGTAAAFTASTTATTVVITASAATLTSHSFVGHCERY